MKTCVGIKWQFRILLIGLIVRGGELISTKLSQNASSIEMLWELTNSALQQSNIQSRQRPGGYYGLAYPDYNQQRPPLYEQAVRPPYGPPPHSGIIDPNPTASIMDVLHSIASNDELHCVPKLLCELTSGSRDYNRQSQYSSSLPFNINMESLLGLVSAFGPSSNPLFHFGKAALLGYTTRGTSCYQAFSKCPNDPDKLVNYLNNYNGGFFRYFQGVPGQGLQHQQNYLEQGQYPNQGFYQNPNQQQLNQGQNLNYPNQGQYQNQGFYQKPNRGQYQNQLNQGHNLNYPNQGQYQNQGFYQKPNQGQYQNQLNQGQHLNYQNQKQYLNQGQYQNYENQGFYQKPYRIPNNQLYGAQKRILTQSLDKYYPYRYAHPYSYQEDNTGDRNRLTSGIRFPDNDAHYSLNDIIPVDDGFHHAKRYKSPRTLIFPDETSANAGHYSRAPKTLTFPRGDRTTREELNFQMVRPNHVASPYIFPTRTGTGELLLDTGEFY